MKLITRRNIKKKKKIIMESKKKKIIMNSKKKKIIMNSKKIIIIMMLIWQRVYHTRI